MPSYSQKPGGGGLRRKLFAAVGQSHLRRFVCRTVVTRLRHNSPSTAALARSSAERGASFRLLRKGASQTLIVSVAGAGVGVLAHLFIARVIGQAEYGVYALMLSWVGVLAVVAQMGQDASVVRFLPTYVLRRQWGYVRGLRRAIRTLVLLTALTIGALGCAWVYWMQPNSGGSWRDTFYIGFAALPLMTQLQQSGAFLRALKRAAASAFYWSVVRRALVIVVLGLAVLFGAHANAPIAALATALGMLIALGLSTFHLRRCWPASAKQVGPTYAARSWLIVGGKLGIMSVVIVAGQRLDVLILGAMASSSLLGAYYAAVQIASLAWYGAAAANVVLGPMIAEHYDAKDYAGLESVVRRAAWYSFLVALACTAVSTLIGKWSLGLFGNGFEAAYIPMLIMMSGYCIAGIMGDGPLVLAMTQYQLAGSLFAAVGVIANFTVAVLLIPRFGAIGAALGVLSAQCVWRALALWFVIRKLHVNPFIFSRAIAPARLSLI